MSADNWTQCPCCLTDRARQIAAEEARVSAMYGTASLDDFDAARHALAQLRAEQLPSTFREDYEFWGADEGFVQWSYKGCCQTCGASAETQGEREVSR